MFYDESILTVIYDLDYLPTSRRTNSLNIPTSQFVSLDPEKNAVRFVDVIDSVKGHIKLLGEKLEYGGFFVVPVLCIANANFVPPRFGVGTIFSEKQEGLMTKSDTIYMMTKSDTIYMNHEQNLAFGVFKTNKNALRSRNILC